MKNVFNYISIFTLSKIGIYKYIDINVYKLIKEKRTLKILIIEIIKHPFYIFKNFLLTIKLKDYKTGYLLYGNNKTFFKHINYIANTHRSLKFIITPSYCEKPLFCENRFSSKCPENKYEYCKKCKFDYLSKITNPSIDYMFLTDDESVSRLLIEGFKYNIKTKGRYILLMSICDFSHSFARLFGIFGSIAIIFTFNNNTCSNIKEYFYGDSGNLQKLNTVSQNNLILYENIKNRLFNFLD